MRAIKRACAKIIEIMVDSMEIEIKLIYDEILHVKTNHLEKCNKLQRKIRITSPISILLMFQFSCDSLPWNVVLSNKVHLIPRSKQLL